MSSYIRNNVDALGLKGIFTIESAGRMGMFLFRTLARMFKMPFPLFETIKQIHFIGAKSLLVIVVSGLFTGMVIALQFYDTLVRFGSVDLMGSAVALSIIRELGPVMTALMVIARVGSATTAEIAIMRYEQQLDALTCMGIDSYRFVMVPRMVAALISVPILTAIFNVVGIIGGYIVGVVMYGVSEGAYLQGMADTIIWKDIQLGLVKSFMFGLVFIWICMAKGFYMHIEQTISGAEGVGRATTQAVVLSAIMMLFVDYIVSALML